MPKVGGKHYAYTPAGIRAANAAAKRQGKKTYMTAAGGVLAAVGAYFSGEMELGMMLNLVITSLLAVFLRKGVKSDTGAESDNSDS